MNTAKMIKSILLLGIFWYLYLGYLLMFEMHMNPMFLILLTWLFVIFFKAVRPLCDHLSNHRKKVNPHEF